jgi:GNAT superfamily N-acetyltransferase
VSDTLLSEQVHNLTYRREDATPNWAADAMDLLKAHYEEVAKFKRLLKPNPDIERYLNLQRLDRLHLVTVRDGALLRGYSIHFIYQHPHYRQVKCAEDDMHYVIPSLRRMGVGKTLRGFALDGLKERGVKFVTARMKVGHEHETHLRELGYTPMEMCWARDLTE